MTDQADTAVEVREQVRAKYARRGCCPVDRLRGSDAWEKRERTLAEPAAVQDVRLPGLTALLAAGP